MMAHLSDAFKTSSIWCLEFSDNAALSSYAQRLQRHATCGSLAKVFVQHRGGGEGVGGTQR